MVSRKVGRNLIVDLLGTGMRLAVFRLALQGFRQQRYVLKSLNKSEIVIGTDEFHFAIERVIKAGSASMPSIFSQVQVSPVDTGVVLSRIPYFPIGGADIVLVHFNDIGSVIAAGAGIAVVRSYIGKHRQSGNRRRYSSQLHRTQRPAPLQRRSGSDRNWILPADPVVACRGSPENRKPPGKVEYISLFC